MKPLLIAAAALLAGCATPDPALQDEARRTTPTCSAAPDCEAMWNAAQLWIVKNAGWKLQTVTPVVLQTYGPSTVTHDSTRLAVTVTREPDGAQFRIVARMSCGNPFGCTPEPLPSLVAFNRAVGAARGTPAP